MKQGGELSLKKEIRHRNVANCLLTKMTKLQIPKYSGPDVSIPAGPFSKDLSAFEKLGSKCQAPNTL